MEQADLFDDPDPLGGSRRSDFWSGYFPFGFLATSSSTAGRGTALTPESRFFRRSAPPTPRLPTHVRGPFSTIAASFRPAPLHAISAEMMLLSKEYSSTHIHHWIRAHKHGGYRSPKLVTTSRVIVDEIYHLFGPPADLCLGQSPHKIRPVRILVAASRRFPPISIF